MADISQWAHESPFAALLKPEARVGLLSPSLLGWSPSPALRRRAAVGMSRLAAAAIRRAAAAASGVPPPSSRPTAFAPVAPRLFSADASGEATGAAEGSQGESFFKPSEEGLAYAKFYSASPGSRRIPNNMLKTDIIHHLDKCGLSLEDVKIDYNRGYYPVGAYGSASSSHLSVLFWHSILHTSIYLYTFVTLNFWAKYALSIYTDE
ncbi:hypothetical protein GUJ93_ZPchr0003g18405 [Zizania palustris]|uniref:Uncharacterized protein n=1 Tax=Zizania palustris TaxID=103762 RepID=A0A8J5VYK1_ZIZPA|nr:hypothetical protein GUJ93_ZPchr0003g18405 [Zizania palustris]KAG8063813.1 hypothetical protein GUJ93_ZPchr0003g18405 [Zizania palustris]